MSTKIKTEEEEPEGPEAHAKGRGCPRESTLKGGDQMLELQNSNTCIIV